MTNHNFTSRAKLNELFRETHAIHELTHRFKNQSNHLQEISINAAIAAGHAGNQTKVFSEIAKQIGGISYSMEDAFLEIEKKTGKMISQVLESLTISSQIDQFMTAMPGITSPENLKAVSDIACQHQLKIAGLLDSTRKDLQRLLPEWRRLNQINERVWSIVINLRVSSGAMATEEERFFFGLADSLEKNSTEISEILLRLARMTQVLNHSIFSFAQHLKEELAYAA